MRFPHGSLYIVTGLIGKVVADPQNILPTLSSSTVLGSANATASTLDEVSSAANRQIIEDCGADENYLRQVITGPLQQILAFANLDVDLGVRSTHGYKAIFKNDDFLPRIRQRLEYMYQRKPIMGLLPSKNIALSPRFACVTENTKKKYHKLKLDFDPWERCNNPVKNGGEEVLTLYVRGTAYIFLCEEFVKSIAPIGMSRCPQISSDRFSDMKTFRDQRDQTYDIIYSLNRFYLGRHALDADTYPVETVDWNECIQTLDAEDSFYNPTSAALYAYLVYNSCTSIPRPPASLRLSISNSTLTLTS